MNVSVYLNNEFAGNLIETDDSPLLISPCKFIPQL